MEGAIRQQSFEIRSGWVGEVASSIERLRSSKRVSLRGETDAGTRVDLDIRSKDGQLHFRLDVRRANLRLAQLCEGTAGSKLVADIEVVDDQGNIIPFAPAVSWSCSAG
jgi:hypothetical protein